MPALTNAERQRRYKARQRRGELRPVAVVLPQEIEAKVRYLIETTGETKTALVARLILEEWLRQGCPIPGFEESN